MQAEAEPTAPESEDPENGDLEPTSGASRAARHRDAIQPLLIEIRRLIKRSDVSQRHVEDRAGFSKGYLSQLLASNLDLKVWHLLAILDVLDEDPATFVARALGSSRPAPGVDPLGDFVDASDPLATGVEHDLARVYQAGIASLGGLRRHVGRVERALEQLEERGLIDPVDGVETLSDLDGAVGAGAG